MPTKWPRVTGGTGLKSCEARSSYRPSGGRPIACMAVSRSAFWCAYTIGSTSARVSRASKSRPSARTAPSSSRTVMSPDRLVSKRSKTSPSPIGAALAPSAFEPPAPA